MTHYERILALQRAMADAVQEAENWKQDYLEMHDRAIRYMQALAYVRERVEPFDVLALRTIDEALREP